MVKRIKFACVIAGLVWSLSPTIAESILHGTWGELTLFPDSTFRLDAPQSGGAPCAGKYVIRGGDNLRLYETYCGYAIQTPDYLEMKFLDACKLVSTPESIFSLYSLNCRRLGSFHSLHYSVPPGSRRILQGLSVIRIEGVTNSPTALRLYSGPSKESEKVFLTHSNIDGSQEIQEEIHSEDKLHCIARSADEQKIGNIGGYWYYIRIVQHEESFSHFRFAWVFSPSVLNCKPE